MTLPQHTPLSLVSELQARINSKNQAAAAALLLSIIIEESDHIQRLANRRFDEFIATHFYDAGQFDDIQGDELVIDDHDLRSIDTLLNGDDTEIPSSGYFLLPRNRTAKHTIQLTENYRWTWLNNKKGAISVSGRWGYGGDWVLLSALEGDILAGDTTISFASAAAFEAGMVLQIEDEYIYINGVSGNDVLVDRAMNGSSAAAHSTADEIYRFRSQSLVTTQIRRLTQWRLEQDKSPLAGQIVIGDFAFPVQTDSVPGDVQAAIYKAGLVKRLPIEAV